MENSNCKICMSSTFLMHKVHLADALTSRGNSFLMKKDVKQNLQHFFLIKRNILKFVLWRNNDFYN